MNENYISTTEAAKILGISPVAVFKKIKKGEIKASKIGRNYVIDKRSLGTIYRDITNEQRKKVAAGVEKAVKEYDEALKKLGKE